MARGQMRPDVVAEYLGLACDVKTCTRPGAASFFYWLHGGPTSTKRRCREHWPALYDALTACGLHVRFASVRARQFFLSGEGR